MDYGKYKNALEKAKVRYNEIKGTNCSEEKFLLELFPELKENKDRIRQGLIKALSSIGKRNWGGIDVFESIAWLEKQGKNINVDSILEKIGVKPAYLDGNAWCILHGDNIQNSICEFGYTKEEALIEFLKDLLEKQKAMDKEIVFRPLAGTDIIAAANQALEKIEIGKEVILAFNGAYIPVNGKTVAEICNEYFSWAEKQGEKKVPSVDFKAKDCYVSKVDGNIHDMTYNPADNVEKKDETKNEQEALNNWYVEYVYILDYSTGRVIVAKHNVKEPISELFEQLGLKENQCHYMTSNTILSIEYINF